MLNRIKGITPATDDFLASQSGVDFFRDAIEIKPLQPLISPAKTQIAIFGHMPGWVNALMKWRNAIVKHFGFDVGQTEVSPTVEDLSVGDDVGFMKILHKTDNEIISHAQDKHMDFYLSTRLFNDKVVLSTMVNKKTRLGKWYVNFIIPFHYVIARAVIWHAMRQNRL